MKTDVFVLHLHDWYLRVYSYSSMAIMKHIIKNPMYLFQVGSQFLCGHV